MPAFETTLQIPNISSSASYYLFVTSQEGRPCHNTCSEIFVYQEKALEIK